MSVSIQDNASLDDIAGGTKQYQPNNTNAKEQQANRRRMINMKELEIEFRWPKTVNSNPAIAVPWNQKSI